MSVRSGRAVPPGAQISSPEALEVLYKLIYNVVVSPAEEKFRRVRLSNPRINAAVLGTEGSLDALRVTRLCVRS